MQILVQQLPIESGVTQKHIMDLSLIFSHREWKALYFFR